MKTICSGFCGEKYDELDMVSLNGKMYCYDCYTKEKYNSLEKVSLIMCIKKIFKTYPTKMMLNQIDKYHDENGWSYKNIRLTIEYIAFIKEINMDIKYGIGLVPHYYDEMIMHYKRKIAQRKEIEDSKKTSKHITVKKKQEQMHKFKKSMLIDIEGIDEDSE